MTIDKSEMRHLASTELPGLQVGKVAWFALPREQPGHRILYQAVQSIAWRLWGAGGYRMRSVGEGVEVMRLKA